MRGKRSDTGREREQIGKRKGGDRERKVREGIRIRKREKWMTAKKEWEESREGRCGRKLVEGKGE